MISQANREVLRIPLSFYFGLSAINAYMGKNDPADYVRYVRGDLMGVAREDMAR
jgi:hypothetical protein